MSMLSTLPVHELHDEPHISIVVSSREIGLHVASVANAKGKAVAARLWPFLAWVVGIAFMILAMILICGHMQ